MSDLLGVVIDAFIFSVGVMAGVIFVYVGVKSGVFYDVYDWSASFIRGIVVFFITDLVD